MRSILFSATVAAVLIAGAHSPAYVHDAPSGWQYPLACCSNGDCYQIDESELVEYKQYWVVRRTKEIFLKPESGNVPGLDNASVTGVATYSPDGLFHRCSIQGDPENGSFCLFVPRPAT